MTKPSAIRGRGRPPAEPHPLEEQLRDHLSPRTCALYGRLFRRIEASGDSAADWLRGLIAEKAAAAKKLDKPSLTMSKSTLTVYRGAVSWYIHLVEQPEVPREVIAKTLPSTGPMREGVERKGLDPEQLARFRELAETADEPARTILLLLPLTGCRISEICYLERDKVDRRRRTITVLGKFNKTREIHLGDVAWTLLSTHLSSYPAIGPLVFMIDTTAGGAEIEPRPFNPRDAWFAVQKWETDRAPGGLLHGVCLHQLRHTLATAQVAAGFSLKAVQDNLGHKDISTAARYVHATDEERRRSMSVLDPNDE